MRSTAQRARLWIRRIHLYCGLSLVPWVLLYAVSGLLFNHPSWSAPDDGQTRFRLRDRVEIDAYPLLQPQRSAEAVALALGPEVEVLEQPAPRLRRSLRASGRDATEPSLSVRFPSGLGAHGVRIRPRERSPVSLEGLTAIDVPGHDAEAWTALAGAVAGTHDDVESSRSLEATPTLRFAATIDGEPWQVDYVAKDGAVSFEPLADKDIRIPRLLARLHMTHVYPDAFGAAWIHALIVDLTALCLAMWCITGLMMWWQLRRVRRVGWVAIASGLAITVALLADVIPPLLS